MKTDLQLIADLIRAGHTEAAERLSRTLDDLAIEREDHRRFEVESRWLLRHAQELPCVVETAIGDREDREQVVVGAEPADPNFEPCDYVLKDCPRLRSLLAGQFTGR